MKAVRLLEYGGQLVFNDVPTPAIAVDEILVKIKSTAVNHLDLVKASGTARQVLPIDLPWIPGHEFSGVVERTGSDVAGYAPGVLYPALPPSENIPLFVDLDLGQAHAAETRRPCIWRAPLRERWA